MSDKIPALPALLQDTRNQGIPDRREPDLTQV